MSHYITENRTILEVLELLQKRGFLTYTTFSEGWIIQIEKAGVCRYVYGYQFDVNSQVAASIAQDKVATHLLLQHAHVDSVPHILLSNVARPNIRTSQLKELFSKYHKLVIKPTHGKHGQFVKLCADVTEVLVFTGSNRSVPSWAASPFMHIQRELRIVVFGKRVAFAYEKSTTHTIDGLKMFNLHLGAQVAYVDPNVIPQEITSLALKAMPAIGLVFGAVDIVFDEKETPYVLEINGGFSLEHFAETSPEHRGKVVEFYKSIIVEQLSG